MKEKTSIDIVLRHLICVPVTSWWLRPGPLRDLGSGNDHISCCGGDPIGQTHAEVAWHWVVKRLWTPSIYQPSVYQHLMGGKRSYTLRIFCIQFQENQVLTCTNTLKPMYTGTHTHIHTHRDTERYTHTHRCSLICLDYYGLGLCIHGTIDAIMSYLVSVNVN